MENIYRSLENKAVWTEEDEKLYEKVCEWVESKATEEMRLYADCLDKTLPDIYFNGVQIADFC